jgi:predicted lipid carrier protein YhbT
LSILNSLVRLEAEQPALFPDKSVNMMLDYRTRQSFRQGATTRAEILWLPGTVTDLNIRWRSVENAKGKKVNHSSMRGYYSGIRLLLVPLLKISQAM